MHKIYLNYLGACLAELYTTPDYQGRAPRVPLLLLKPRSHPRSRTVLRGIRCTRWRKIIRPDGHCTINIKHYEKYPITN